MNTSYPSTNSLVWIYLRFSTHIVIILSTILFLFQLGGYNPVQFITKHKLICTILQIVLVISILMVGFSRNFYLPFLGWSVYPCGSLAEKVPADANVSVMVKVPPNVNVIYWATEPNENTAQPISNPWDAYANYDNSGVVKANSNGNAILRVREPSSYNVGLLNKTLKRHIHYRICHHSGMLSEVKTAFI
jgi:hypothetical protein